MQPIEGQTAEAFEVIGLESWLDDELKCESRHLRTGKEACTVHVTHLSSVACQGQTKFVCEVAARWNSDGIARGGNCSNCGHPARDCWKIRPI